ncbi:hypothetical protein ACFFQ7_02100 [Roseibacillus persicicus]
MFSLEEVWCRCTDTALKS